MIHISARKRFSDRIMISVRMIITIALPNFTKGCVAASGTNANDVVNAVQPR